jgi:hypothetical protein
MTDEEAMKKALADLESYSKPNYTEIAKKHGVGRYTLSRRHQGQTTSRRDFFSNYRQCLTDIQEQLLIDQINRLTDRGIPPTSQIVKNFIEEMIRRAMGKNWTDGFVKRHTDVLKSLYLRNIDNQRVKGQYIPAYRLFFTLVLLFLLLLFILAHAVADFSRVTQLARAIEKYNLTAENIYNWDEKGFLMGVCRALKRIMTKEAYTSSRCKQNAQPKSREFITLLACVSTIGRRLPSALIYKSESYELRDT